MSSDITLFCHSCDVCQCTVSKGRISKVPLGTMPIIDIPFKRVAIDIVGEIFPASSHGHCYILTLVDYATRYAEALVGIFARVGIPDEILSDRGTQLTSAQMKEVKRLLLLKQLTTTPYHPQCNGLVEHFNGTLKMMLKHMCAEKPKDWDHYISALLFAYREASQQSLGFAPFKLLYGRTVKGPLQILRQLWTKEETDPETRSTYQYVFELRNRLQDTLELAHEALRTSQVRQKRQFDSRTRERIFKYGDMVLILLPTSDNKLLTQWKGPFKALERINGCNYRIQLGDKEKIFHANMLQWYVSAEAVSDDKPTLTDSEDLDIQVTQAAIMEPVEDPILDPNLGTLNPLQKETIKDVKISSNLSETQKEEVRALLTEFEDTFTDVPSVTNAGEHTIELTTAEPIRGKA